MKGERDMISVKAEYINMPNKHGTDYFIYTNIEVTGHSSKAGSYTNNIRLCAGVSACCYGIRRVIDDERFNLEYRSGYFHCYTDRRSQLKTALDRESVYALNTLVCQLYELYLEYPNSFNSFELIDVKEKIESDERKNKPTKPRKKRNRMGLYSLIKEPYLEEN